MIRKAIQDFLDNKLGQLLDVKDTCVYNEFSLQHELGIYLRQKLPNNYRVQFERNVDDVFPGNGITIKKEMDIYIFNKSNVNEKYAIELKFPRNGAYPKRMSQFIDDIKFMDGVKKAGATKTYVLTLVEDKNFYTPTGRKTANNTYECFRGIENNGIYIPPQKVCNQYQIEWKPVKGADSKYRYYFLEI